MATPDTNSERRVLDSISKLYCEDTGFEYQLTKYKVDTLGGYVQGKSFLDVGCGVGLVAKAFADRFERIVGIDGAPRKIELARRHNSAPNITYYDTLFEEFKPGEKFDFIVCTNVLEHVTDPPAFLGLLKSWLSPGGRMFLSVPNAWGLHKRIGKIAGLIDDPYALSEEDIAKGHHRVYDPKSLRADVEKAGLKVIKEGGILLKPLSSAQMEAWDQKLVDALYEIGKELPQYCSSIHVLAGHLYQQEIASLRSQ